MATDIHAVIEYYNETAEPPSWWLFAQVELNRDYDTFGLMAGVRRPEHKLFAPRGIPAGCTSIPEKASRHGDYHTFSWLTFDELRLVVQAVHPFFHVRVGQVDQPIKAVLEAMCVFESVGVTTRLVFWFDC